MNRKLITWRLILLALSCLPCAQLVSQHAEWSCKIIPVTDQLLVRDRNVLTVTAISEVSGQLVVFVSARTNAIPFYTATTKLYTLDVKRGTVAPYCNLMFDDSALRNRWYNIDGAHQIIAGDSKLWVSSDSGKSWILNVDSLRTYYHNHKFYGNMGIASYNRYSYALSLDFGTHWSLLPFPDSSTIDVATVNHLFIVDSSTILNIRQRELDTPTTTRSYISTNRGSSWTSLGSTLEGQLGDSSTASLFHDGIFMRPDFGVVTGVLRDSTQLDYNFCALSSNGGRNWKVVNKERVQMRFDSVPIFYSTVTHVRDTVIVVQDDGNLIIGTSNGQGWEHVTSKRPKYPTDTGDSNEVISAFVSSYFRSAYTAIACPESRSDKAIILMYLDSAIATSVSSESLHWKDVANSASGTRHTVSASHDLLTVRLCDVDCGSTDIKLSVYDMNGDLVSVVSTAELLKTFSDPRYSWFECHVSIQSLPMGVYVCRLTNGHSEFHQLFSKF